MANERIEVEIVLDDGSIQKGFTRLNQQGKQTGESLTRVFTTAFAAFAGFAGLGKIIGNLREFEKAFQEINTITNLTAQQQKVLNDQLIATSAQFGTSASDQAKAFYQIISAGVTDATRANELLAAANKLAIGGLSTTAASIDILTSAVNAFGQENLSAQRASDILFGTVRLGKTTVDQLAGSLGQILPSASALGVSFEDTNAALAALTTRGVSTSEAVTQLNAIFTAVLKKQGEAKKILGDNAEAFSLQALQTKGLTAFLRDLNTALGGSEERLVKLTGRAEGARAIITLAGDNFKTLENNTNALNNSLGASDEAFNKINTTVDQKINKSTAKAEAIFLKLSQTTSGPLAGALDFLNKQLDDLLIAFDSFRNFGDFIEASLSVASIAIIDFTRTAIVSLQKIPFIGDKIAKNLTAGIIDELDRDKAFLEQRITSLIQTTEAPIVEKSKDLGRKIGKGVADGVKESFQASAVDTSITLAEISNTIFTPFNTRTEDGLKKLKQAVDSETAQIASLFKNTIGGGVSQAFASFGKAVATGQDGLQALGDSVLQTLGSLAIQLGQFFILVGTGLTATTALLGISGGAAIAAGIALSVLGGVLQAAGGGGAGATGASAAGGGAGAGLTDVGGPAEDEDLERGTAVTVNVEGTVLDPVGVGQQIAEILDETFNAGASSIRVNSA